MGYYYCSYSKLFRYWYSVYQCISSLTKATQGGKTSQRGWIIVNEVSPSKSYHKRKYIANQEPLSIKRVCMKHRTATERCTTEEEKKKTLTFQCCLEVLVKKCHWWKGMLNSVIPENSLATWNKTKTNIQLTVHSGNDREINNWWSGQVEDMIAHFSILMTTQNKTKNC